MLTAPSFKDYTIVSEPFEENGRMYIKARNPKLGNVRKIRVYTEKEYKRQWGDPPSTSKSVTERFRGLQKARGFSQGPITIIRGDIAANEEFLNYSIARYAVDVGWYVVSTDQVPELPPSLYSFPLDWEEFERGKRENSLNKILRTKENLFDPSKKK